MQRIRICWKFYRLWKKRPWAKFNQLVHILVPLSEDWQPEYLTDDEIEERLDMHLQALAHIGK